MFTRYWIHVTLHSAVFVSHLEYYFVGLGWMVSCWVNQHLSCTNKCEVNINGPPLLSSIFFQTELQSTQGHI